MRGAIVIGAGLCVASACAAGTTTGEPVQVPTEPLVAEQAEPAEGAPPQYKPSSSSKRAQAITTDAYGAYSDAPNAPRLGDVVDDFVLPTVDGGSFRLEEARKAGPVLVMFYRGFW